MDINFDPKKAFVSFLIVVLFAIMGAFSIEDFTLNALGMASPIESFKDLFIQELPSPKEAKDDFYL